MSWCEFDNWSSSGVQFDQRLMTKYCSRITSKIPDSRSLKIIRTENSILESEITRKWKNEMKLERMKFESSSGSWKILHYFNATMKTYQLRSLVSNLNGNFRLSNFPTSRFFLTELSNFMYPRS